MQEATSGPFVQNLEIESEVPEVISTLTEVNLVGSNASKDKEASEVVSEAKGVHQAEMATLPKINDQFPLGGRLKHFWQQWDDPEIRALLKKGLNWKWTKEKPPYFTPPMWSSMDKRLVTPVQEMLFLEVISPIREDEILFLGNIFGKVKPNGKIRTILDISNLKTYIVNEHFKMLQLKEVPLVIQPKDYFISIDLTSAYWHIPIDEEFQPYLCFKFLNNFYKFQAMPFGLSIAPRLFTQIMGNVVKTLVKLNIQILIYLDDILIIGSSVTDLLTKRLIVLRTLKDYGLIVNWNKSELVPTQEITFLGLIWNSKTMTVQLAEPLIEKILVKFQSLTFEQKANLKDMQSIAGSLEHASFVIRNLKPSIKTIFMTSVQNRRKTKTLRTPLEEVFYQTTSSINQKLLSQKRSLFQPSIVSQMMVDASLKGWRAIVTSTTPHQIAAGIWKGKDKSLPIVILEAKAMYLGLLAFNWEKQQKIVILSDCKPAVGALNKGGSTRSKALQAQILRIWNRVASMKLTVTAIYIKGKRNVLADQLSRKHQCLPGEWALSRNAFKWILELDHNPEIDIFATDWNNQLPNFCTHYKSSNTPYMDAFSVDWSQWKVIYAFPPPLMLLKVLDKIQQHKGKILLVFPEWPNRPWYQIIQQRASQILRIPFQDLWQGHPACPIHNLPACWLTINIAIFTHSS